MLPSLFLVLVCLPSQFHKETGCCTFEILTLPISQITVQTGFTGPETFGGGNHLPTPTVEGGWSRTGIQSARDVESDKVGDFPECRP